MNDLLELLATRDTQGDTLVLRGLRDGLAPEAARSGSAASLHTLLLDCFALDQAATTRSFTRAFRRHRHTAQALLVMLEQDGQMQAAGLMRSLLEGRRQPTGKDRMPACVMLLPDDVHGGTPRYPSLAHFVAALRLCPQAVLGNGGYVCYVVPEHQHLLYPVGQVDGDGDGAAS